MTDNTVAKGKEYMNKQRSRKHSTEKLRLIKRPDIIN
jgi:hypothetical protein